MNVYDQILKHYPLLFVVPPLAIIWALSPLVSVKSTPESADPYLQPADLKVQPRPHPNTPRQLPHPDNTHTQTTPTPRQHPHTDNTHTQTTPTLRQHPHQDNTHTQTAPTPRQYPHPESTNTMTTSTFLRFF